MFLTSQVGITSWQASTNVPPCRITNWTDPACRFRTENVATKHYLIPDLEDYSIRITHSARGRVVDAEGETTMSAGRLVGVDGSTFKEFPEAEQYDYLLLSELLQAAGGLNEKCRDPPPPHLPLSRPIHTLSHPHYARAHSVTYHHKCLPKHSHSRTHLLLSPPQPASTKLAIPSEEEKKKQQNRADTANLVARATAGRTAMLFGWV